MTVTNAAGTGDLAATMLGRLDEQIAAVHDEITRAREDRSRSFEILNGRLICEVEGGYLYVFESESEIGIPADSPVQVAVTGADTVAGSLLGMADFEVTLVLQTPLGQEVPRARLSADPWFILEQLAIRLTECREKPELLCGLAAAVIGETKLAPGSSGEAPKVAERLFSSNPQATRPNTAQCTAIAACAGSPIHFVWGPPGTGKTAVLAQTVRVLVEQGERVLVLAHANAALDVAMLRTAHMFSDSPLLGKGCVLRYGVPQLAEVRARPDIYVESIIERTYPDLIRRRRELQDRRSQLIQDLRGKRRRETGQELETVRAELAGIVETIRVEGRRLISEARVLGATLSKLAIDGAVWTWPADAVVVDEASMAGIPFITAAATRARKRLLGFGDFRQLPPISLAETDAGHRWLGRDVFEVSGVRANVDRGADDSRLTLLDTQYRMAPAIAKVVSRFAYGGRLQTATGVAERVAGYASAEPGRGQPLVCIDTSGLRGVCCREARPGSYSRLNTVHLSAALAIIDRLSKLSCSVGVISPYRAQAKLYRDAIEGLGWRDLAAAATVHRFQGAERDVVIVDLVDSFPESRASRLTGEVPDTALRLLNVAISRARGKLIVLADLNFVRERHYTDSPARRLLMLIEDSGMVIAAESEISRASGKAQMLNWGGVCESLVQDVRAHAGPIFVNVPDGLPVPEPLVAVLGAAAHANQVIVFGSTALAESVENTAIDYRFMIRAGGFLALIGDAVYVGGVTDRAAFGRIESAPLAVGLQHALLGQFPHQRRPDAVWETRIAALCGRCPECGENRRPRREPEGAWGIHCGGPGHPREPVTAEFLRDILKIRQLVCLKCGGAAVVREGKSGPFFGCSNYRSGCRGKPPGLEILFGS
jgi:hypothetical protein